MVQVCAAIGCDSKRTVESRQQGISFHMVPVKLELRRSWEKALRREGFQATKHTVLCSKHFRPDDFDRTGQTIRLRDNVVPSIFSFPEFLVKKSRKTRKMATSEQATAPAAALDPLDFVEASCHSPESESGETVCLTHFMDQDDSDNNLGNLAPMDVPKCDMDEIPAEETTQMDSCYIKEEVIDPTSVTVYLKEEQECDLKIKEEPADYDEPISIQQNPIEPEQEKRDDFILGSNISQVVSSKKDFDMTLKDRSQKGRNIFQQVRGGRVAKKTPVKDTAPSKNLIVFVYDDFAGNNTPHTTITEQGNNTQVSVRTIKRFKTETYTPPNGMIYSSEPPIRHSPVMNNLNDFHRECIRREILSFYERGEQPTINKLLTIVKDPPLNFNASRSSLYRLLEKVGFCFRRTQNGKSILVESEDVALTRNEYLREMKENRENPQPLQEVYLDETWATDDGVVQPKLNPNAKKGSGQIIIHAGGRQGFIPGALLVYKHKNRTRGDIHDVIDPEQFKTWFENQLLPNLKEGSLIIMDDAPYHSKLSRGVPTDSNTKREIIQWLEVNNISYDSSCSKGELIDKCEQHKEEMASEMDQIALNYGHRVLRLPQYCCMLNPVELIWAQVEEGMKNQITSSEESLEDIEQITRKAIQEITSEQWQECIQHTMEVEEDYRAKAIAQNNYFENFEIDLQSEESSDESSDETMEN